MRADHAPGGTLSDERRDPWLTEKEAAKELRVSAYVVRAERAAGRLGFARIRSRIFYPTSELDAYRARALQPAIPPAASAEPSWADAESTRQAMERGRRAAIEARRKGIYPTLLRWTGQEKGPDERGQYRGGASACHLAFGFGRIWWYSAISAKTLRKAREWADRHARSRRRRSA